MIRPGDCAANGAVYTIYKSAYTKFMVTLSQPMARRARLPLRPPSELMTPEALGAFKASRLSFLRLAISRMVAERWTIERCRFDLDEHGRGTVVYRLNTAGAPLFFVVFSDDVGEAGRTDRIIANRYDGEGFLCMTEPDDERLAFHRAEFADFLLGRADSDTIGWTRVNRSGRVFDTMVEALADGRQPDVDSVMNAGYLLRNNGFWGNGRHGSAIFPAFAEGEFIARPYHGDLLTLFMWRHFSVDLVEHMARARNPNAAALAPDLKRFIGVGNASGLGLIPFVIRHPRRIHTWVLVHEEAVARAKSMTVAPGAPEAARLVELIARAEAYFRDGIQIREGVFTGSERLVRDLERLAVQAAEVRDRGTVQGAPADLPWAALADWAAASLDREALEILHSLLIEVYPAIADDLAPRMLAPVDAPSDVIPHVTVGDLGDMLRSTYAWALTIDMTVPEARAHFWYLSEDNLEPRHGLRSVDPGEEFETFVDIVGELQALDSDLLAAPGDQTVAAFLFAHPGHRLTVERVQSTADCLYGDVRANVTDKDFEPCHLIRFLLVLYGMEKLDPQSKLWVRGTFLQGAPTADDIAAGVEGDWIYPLRPQQ
jgi:hypothetical protein